jgi:hypothetical protein
MENAVLQRISRQIANRNVKDGLNDLRQLHEAFCAIVSLLHENNIELPHVWYEFYETMAIKFRLNVYSIIELYSIEDGLPQNIIYHDLSSIYLLNRSLLETYLTFFYSFIMPESEEEGLMNYYIFKISGLVQRQAYGVKYSFTDSDDWDKHSDIERQKIIEYQNKLQALPIFQVLPLNSQKKKDLLNGKHARRFSFIELIEKSSLNNILFVDMWKLYSNYAHCELLGLLQINGYADDPKDINSALYGTNADIERYAVQYPGYYC